MRWLTEHYPITRGEILACCGLALVCGSIAAALVTPVFGFFSVYLMVVMLLITVIDSRCMRIPDVLSMPAIPVGLIAAMVAHGATMSEMASNHLLAAVVASGLFYAIREIYLRLRGFEGLGLGDVKLAAAAGAWLGLDALPVVCLLATITALATVLLRQWLNASKPTLTTAVPFGSFIAPAIVITWFAGVGLN